jgi:hypothetical protein
VQASALTAALLFFASDWVEHGDEPRGALARVAQEIAAQRLNIVRRHVFHRAHIACENLFLDLTIRRKVKSQNLLFKKTQKLGKQEFFIETVTQKIRK